MSYSIKRIFDTIQGEGARAGTRAVFVRFAGCNLWNGTPEGRAQGKGACARWCDTEFTGGTKMDYRQVLEMMGALWPDDLTCPPSADRWCVLTGGEPTLQVDWLLLEALHRAGWKVAMETNGTVLCEVTHSIDWLTVSPKLGGEVVLEHGDELKVVLPGAHPPEEGWRTEALLELARRSFYGFKFVQPMDPPLSGGTENTLLHPAVHSSMKLKGADAAQDLYVRSLAQCLEFVKLHPDWRLGAQLHKYWRLP